MKYRESVRFFMWITLTALVVALVVSYVANTDGYRMTHAQSPAPTATFTPAPTNTPVPPPTPTNTPVPPTPTDTPVPPTPTPTDTAPPVSWVIRLRPVHFTRSFRVRWRGHDRGGSGIECYDVQYKDGPGAWQDWRTCTASTSASFHGERGHRYFFRARAMDNAGNVEAWPSQPDTWTYVRGWMWR